MFRSLRIPGLVGVCAVLSWAQPVKVPSNIQRGFATIQAESLKRDLTYVASDALEGRMSLSPGDDKAISWIADQFQQSGLHLSLQRFNLVEYVPDRPAFSLTVAQGGHSKAFHAPEAFGAYKDSVDLTAPVVFAGFGITAPELGYDDYTGLDAKGKIVVVFEHEPQEDDPHSIFNGTGLTRYATSRVKLLNAQAHGAVGVILMAEPNRHHPTNAERLARIGGSITRGVPLPLQAIQDDELHIPLIQVQNVAAAEILAQAGVTPSALQAGIDKDLKPQSRSLGDTTLSIHMKNRSERVAKTANVAGLLEGSDPTLKAETILITAHHDHDGESPCVPEKGGVDQTGQATAPGKGCLDIWHGADDNGSGTVGVVALARAFRANPLRPKRSILFVVFAAEERGLLGAYWMAAHPLRSLATTRAQINFDMIGRDEKPSRQTDGLIEIPAETGNRLNLVGALYSPQYESLIEQEDKTIGLDLDHRFDHESVLNVFFRSDQFPFVLKGIPAFWWFTGFHPDYHHTTDTVEKIDFPKMTRILQLAYLVGWRLGTDAHTPAFVPNPAAE